MYDMVMLIKEDYLSVVFHFVTDDWELEKAHCWHEVV
jgi:hypothetical protein